MVHFGRVGQLGESGPPVKMGHFGKVGQLGESGPPVKVGHLAFVKKWAIWQKWTISELNAAREHFTCGHGPWVASRTDLGT